MTSQIKMSFEKERPPGVQCDRGGAQQDSKNQALREDPKHAVGRAGESRFSTNGQ